MGYKSKKTAPQKHKSRWRFYGGIPLRVLHSEAHILMPSQDCGDIKVLDILEVDKELILAADTDPLAVAAAGEYEITVRREDVLVTLERALNEEVTIGTLNLDYCDSCTTTADYLAVALRANVKYVMYTFSQRSGKSLPNAQARRDWIISKCGQTPIEEWNYQSCTKSSQGQAMTCMIFRGSGNQPRSLYERKPVQEELPAPIRESEPRACPDDQAVTACSVCYRSGHNKATCGRTYRADAKFRDMGIVGGICTVIKEYRTAHGRNPKCGEIIDRLPTSRWSKPYIRVALCCGKGATWRREGKAGSSTYALI